MPVNSTHPDYDAALPSWLRARDVMAGEDAVKRAGEKYLPRLDAQTDEEYAAYRDRALFFNATARTAEGYVGLIFRRPPFVKVVDADTSSPRSDSGKPHDPHPPSGHPLPLPQARDKRGRSALGTALSAFNNDADMLGTPLMNYAKNVVNEVISVGRAGTLIDWEDQVENRVYATLYHAEDILNWRVERINGRNLTTLIVLMERAEGRNQKSEVDVFEQEAVEQIRVLRLVEGSVLGSEHPSPRPSPLVRRGERASEGQVRGARRDYACVVEIWRREETKKVTGGNASSSDRKDWKLMETRMPLRLGKPLPLIPFVFHGARHSHPGVEKLPLEDIITVNLDHYRLNADYKHGIHFTALPTAWVSGFDKSSTLRIGASTAWVTETPGATAGFLEFTGQGLTTFERAMDRDERHLAVLGTRLLEAQKRVGEAAEAIELRQSGENSILGNIAINVSASLTQVLRWAHWWNSTEDLPDDVTNEQVLMELNTDFSTKGLSAQEIQAIVAAWQASAISRDTMTDLFRRGEVLPEGRTNEEEARRVGWDAIKLRPTKHADLHS